MAHGSTRRGFFRGALDSIVAARSAQAARYVDGALLMLDDETLAAHGYNREQLRKRGASYYPF